MTSPENLFLKHKFSFTWQINFSNTQYVNYETEIHLTFVFKLDPISSLKTHCVDTSFLGNHILESSSEKVSPIV